MPTSPPPPARAAARFGLHPARERDDVLLLAVAAALVPFGWLLAGWRWPSCVSGYDAWATALPLLDALRSAGGDWSALAYRPDLLGGTRLRDAAGPNPLVALLARTGLHATGIYDLAAFALQALIGFFGARAAADLPAAWGDRAAAARGTEWLVRVASVVLCAFAPALGWRLGYGHLAMTTGLLPFAAALALVAAATARRVSLTLLAAAALATADGLLFTGHQLVLYGAVFGAPILAGIWLAARVPARALAAPALALGVGLLLALPAFSGVLDHGLGGDSPRSPAGLRITYSYLTAGPLDWVTSLPWTRAAIPGHRPPLHHHESNVPLGPLLALLVLAPWHRARALAWGLGITAALVLAFSMDLRPVSTLLLAAIPPLGSFRVPTRAALPLVLTLSPLAIAAVRWAISSDERRSRGFVAWLAGAAGFALLWLAPPPAREILGWAATGLLAASRWTRRELTSGVAAAALLAASGGALGAFAERLLPPFRDTETLLARAREIGADVAAREPDLRRPLVRVVLEGGLPELGANTAFAAGLSSLDGYFFPSRRLVALACALRRQPYDPSAFVLRFRADEPAGRVLLPLYNVRWTARNAAAEGAAEPAVPNVVPPARDPAAWRPHLEPLAATAGPAWFSETIEAVPDIDALAARLREDTGPLEARLRRTVWVAATDRAARALPAATAGECARASVSSVTADHGGRFALGVVAPASCPLTIATNYAESLRGRVKLNGRWSEVRLFPAYGALLGVWVPAGATEVRIGPR